MAHLANDSSAVWSSGNNIRVSVITVSRNAESTIKLTLSSVNGQKGVEGLIEHIVIDGASTDGTMDIVRGFPYVHWISEPDNGIADAFNKGLAMARGEYLLYLNSDDYLYDDQVLRDAVNFIDEYKKPTWVVGDVLVDRNGKIERSARLFPPSCWSMIFRNRICHQAVFLRRDVLRLVGGFDRLFRISMDYDLWQRLCSHGFRPTYWPRVISVYSMTGISSQNSIIHQVERQVIMRRFRNTLFKRVAGKAYDMLQKLK